MSELDDILADATWPEIRECYPNGESRIVDSLPEAKEAIIELFLGLIGEDEPVQPEYEKPYDGNKRRTRNQLRKQLRQKVNEL